MTVRVKICGVTTPDDARAAWDAGADAIGINFWPGSKRFVDPRAAEALVRTRPAFGSVVGVFVDEQPEVIRAIARALGLAAVQLHGNEPLTQRWNLGAPVIKALRVRAREDIERARAYARGDDVAAVLLDGDAPGYGGAGVGFPWALAAELTDAGLAVIVAGGLHPGNVAAAVRATRPYAVDVASGVERAPGLKDHDKLRAFVRAAQQDQSGVP